MTDEEKLEPTLLDRAKATRPKVPTNAREYTREDAELSVHWAAGDVTLKGVGEARGIQTGSSQLAYLAYSLRHAFRLGLVSVNDDKIDS